VAEDLSQKELADRIGVVPRTVRRLIDQRILVRDIPDEGNPTYPWPENRERYWSYKEELLRSEILAELGDPTDPARRKLEAEARRAELQLAEIEEALIPIELLDETVAELLDRLQSVILNIPGSWAPHLVKLTSRRAAMVKLRPLMGELLESLQATADDFDADEADG